MKAFSVGSHFLGRIGVVNRERRLETPFPRDSRISLSRSREKEKATLILCEEKHTHRERKTLERRNRISALLQSTC